MTDRSMSDKCLQKLIQERDMLDMMVQTFTKTSTGADLHFVPTKAFVDHHNEIIRRYLTGEPFITSYFCCAPEIYTAMDLPWNTFLTPAFTGALMPAYHDEIDASGKMFRGMDLCTIIRLAAYMVEEDLVPPPTAVIAMIHPCDGINVVHQVMAKNEKWGKIPVFGADPPYWEDERSYEYYADELKKMVAFLEKHTGLNLDTNRLREVIKESNKQIALWQEFNELRRAVPCPHGGAMGLEVFGEALTVHCGMPIGTAWLKDVIADAESLVKQGKGAVPKERIRLFWFDVLSLGLTLDLFPWLEQEWGAVVVMEMFGYAPYTQIGTSSEDSMFKGMAKRALHEVPMIRQARGVADYFLSDIERIVKDYKIDCVIFPGYMGHKDGSANVGLMREKCRELGVPFLYIGMDLFDDRYTTLDELKDKCSTFFTAMGLG
jgi:benzoyl-CoA reductase subunit B